jgi:hypothetical protein
VYSAYIKKTKTKEKTFFSRVMESPTLDSCCNILIAVIGLIIIYMTASVAGISSGYILLTVVALAVIMGVATFAGVGGNALLFAVIAAGVILAMSQTTGFDGTYLFIGLIILTMFMGLASMLGISGAYMGVALVAILVVVGIGWYILGGRSATMPTLAPFQDMKKDEGFYGGVAVGAGVPDCLRTSIEGARLYSIFAGRVSGVEEGPADLRELELLLSQLSCFKKDLMGVAQQVEATRYQPFATELDMEPIAETTARCFAKTIPPRDLELSFEKWSKRGMFLITRLCTAARLSEAEVVEAEKLFRSFIADISEVAKKACLTGTPTIQAQPQLSPRDARAYDPGSSGREYFGYY